MTKLYKENRKEWKTRVSTAIRENPKTFRMMDFGKNDDGNLLLSKDEFEDHFKGTYSSNIISMIWNELDKTDSNEVKFTTLHRFIQNITSNKRRERRNSVHDADWLFNVLKNMQFVHLDTDEGGTITKEEFIDGFKDKDIDKNLLEIVFNQIDINGDGDVTVMEFTRWQHKITPKKVKFYNKQLIKKKEKN